jgi:hypothetical protein
MMRFVQVLTAAAGLFAGVNAWADESTSTIYTTVVTTAYETYCPVSGLDILWNGCDADGYGAVTNDFRFQERNLHGDKVDHYHHHE